MVWYNLRINAIIIDNVYKYLMFFDKLYDRMNDGEKKQLLESLGVYYVSKSNFGAGQKMDDYSDFSFLGKENFDNFVDKVKSLQLSQEEIDRLKEQREKEMDTSLVKLNNDIYQNEKVWVKMTECIFKSAVFCTWKQNEFC